MSATSEAIICVVAILTIGALIALFAGEPDLHDVLMYRLSDGKIPIPTAPEVWRVRP